MLTIILVVEHNRDVSMRWWDEVGIRTGSRRIRFFGRGDVDCYCATLLVVIEVGR
jgi:hypothetical protein